MILRYILMAIFFAMHLGCKPANEHRTPLFGEYSVVRNNSRECVIINGRNIVLIDENIVEVGFEHGVIGGKRVLKRDTSMQWFLLQNEQVVFFNNYNAWVEAQRARGLPLIKLRKS